MIPENVLYWVRFLTEIENTKLNFSDCKGIMFDTNLSYSETNEAEMLTDSKIAAYGDAARYIDSFKKGDYALFYSKGRGIIAIGKIASDSPMDIPDIETKNKQEIKRIGFCVWYLKGVIEKYWD